MQTNTRPATVDGIPVVWGFTEAAKVANRDEAFIGERMDEGELGFLHIDDEYVFIRSSLERLAA